MPNRDDLKLICGDVGVILFDFDGTLTASPGNIALRAGKQAELRERATLLAPRLQSLREANVTLGIISKSTENTIRTALDAAGLADYFNGPLLGKATGLEGKAGHIEDLVRDGPLRHLGPEGWRRTVLVDDDLRELDRARAAGIQTFAAPSCGGLQTEDFDELFQLLGLGPAAPERPQAAGSSVCRALLLEAAGDD